MSWNSTCFRQFVCHPSSGVYSLYTQQWHMSYRFVDSFRAGKGWNCSKAVYKPVWHTIVKCTVNKLLMMDSRTAETWRVSWQNKFVKLVHLFGFITKEKTPTDVSLVISARCIFTFVQLTLVNCFSKIFRVYCVISWGLSRCLTCKSEQVVTTARNWI